MKKRASLSAKAAKPKSNSNLDNDEEMGNEIELTESILEAKAMQERLLLEEERGIIIQELMDELLGKTLEECYKTYIHRQTIAFTVHCACLALLDVIDFYMPSCDPGEPCGTAGRPQWLRDILPTQLNSDTWAGQPLPLFFGRPFKMSSAKYYKELADKNKSGHKAVKKIKKIEPPLPDIAISISKSVNEPENNVSETIEEEKPVPVKKKVTSHRGRSRPSVSGKNATTREQREKPSTTTEPTKPATGRVVASNVMQGDSIHFEGSYNHIAMEVTPASQLEEERIEMKYWVLPSEQGKSPPVSKQLAKTGFCRKDKKKSGIINLV